MWRLIVVVSPIAGLVGGYAGVAAGFASTWSASIWLNPTVVLPFGAAAMWTAAVFALARTRGVTGRTRMGMMATASMLTLVCALLTLEVLLSSVGSAG